MKLDLLTNATVVDDVMKFLEQAKEKLEEKTENIKQASNMIF
jgi:hypothetical protein